MAAPGASGDPAPSSGATGGPERSSRGRRTALLAQPGGFEGFVAIVEHPYSTDLAIGERKDRDVGRLHPHTAGASNLVLADDCHNLVARVDQLLHPKVDLSEAGEHLAHQLTHTF